MSKVITIMNQKGGCGKTTTTAIIAIYKAIQGARVLCVDCDPQGGLTSFLTGKEPETTENSLFDYIMGGEVKPHKIEKENCNIDLLSADYRLDKIFSTCDIYTFSELKETFSEYDVIVFDTPPTVQGITKSACFISDVILTPADLSRGTISPTIYTIESLKHMKKKTNVFIITKEKTNGFIDDLKNELIAKLDGVYKTIPDGITFQKLATENKKWTDKQISLVNEIFQGVL